jgi:hypothetical protein
MMAEENATGARTVFAAVVAFTGKRTPDGRVIVAPEGFRCPASEDIPVMGWTEEPSGVRFAVRIGKISEAYVIDGRITVFGHLDQTPRARKFTALLADGSHRLEIDFDHVTMEFMNEVVGAEELPVAGDVHMVNWRLRAAFVGDKPCWDLPPVQIEEMTR